MSRDTRVIRNPGVFLLWRRGKRIDLPERKQKNCNLSSKKIKKVLASWDELLYSIGCFIVVQWDFYARFSIDLK